MIAWGCNRVVFLVGPYAVKIPRPSSWRNFLFGLLNNIHEAAWSSAPGACPIVARVPGGWANIMPRCRILTASEFQGFDCETFCTRSGLRVERKPDSFGWLRDEIVAVDYGW